MSFLVRSIGRLMWMLCLGVKRCKKKKTRIETLDDISWYNGMNDTWLTLLTVPVNLMLLRSVYLNFTGQCFGATDKNNSVSWLMTTKEDKQKSTLERSLDFLTLL